MLPKVYSTEVLLKHHQHSSFLPALQPLAVLNYNNVPVIALESIL